MEVLVPAALADGASSGRDAEGYRRVPGGASTSAAFEMRDLAAFTVVGRG